MPVEARHRLPTLPKGRSAVSGQGRAYIEVRVPKQPALDVDFRGVEGPDRMYLRVIDLCAHLPVVLRVPLHPLEREVRHPESSAVEVLVSAQVLRMPGPLRQASARHQNEHVVGQLQVPARLADIPVGEHADEMRRVPVLDRLCDPGDVLVVRLRPPHTQALATLALHPQSVIDAQGEAMPPAIKALLRPLDSDLRHPRIRVAGVPGLVASPGGLPDRRDVPLAVLQRIDLRFRFRILPHGIDVDDVV